MKVENKAYNNKPKPKNNMKTKKIKTISFDGIK